MSKWRVKQKGLTQVEFTLVALSLLLVIFAIMEFSLYFYSVQMSNEVTRRAARLATVCYIADRDDIPKLPTVANLYPPGFTEENLKISYLDRDGNDDFFSDPTLSENEKFKKIRYVEAKADYTFQFSVLSLLINAIGATPEFRTILPAESLGVQRNGEITDC